MKNEIFILNGLETLITYYEVDGEKIIYRITQENRDITDLLMNEFISLEHE